MAPLTSQVLSTEGDAEGSCQSCRTTVSAGPKGLAVRCRELLGEPGLQLPPNHRHILTPLEPRTGDTLLILEGLLLSRVVVGRLFTHRHGGGR